MARGLFTNTKVLARHIWRRDRIQIPVWLISIIAFTIAIAAGFPAMYPPGPERQIVAQTFENPALISMLGPGYGLDNYHMGAIMAHQMLLVTAVVVAIMNITLTIRHTRRDEEHGRIEVIRSLPVGRLSNAASTMIVLSITNLALGVVTGLGLALLGLEGMDLFGSLSYGAVLTVTGIFFAAITLFFAQLTETARAASGYSFVFLGLAYLLRAIGDISSELLSLISPLGLVLRAQVYVNNYWWPLIITLVAAILIMLAAFKLNTMRDLEAGFIPAKPGREHASRFLQSPLGLALRLERTTIIGWAIGMFVLGASYGSVYGDVEDFVQTSELYQIMLQTSEGVSLLDQFTAMLLSVMSMMAAVPVLLVFLKLRNEEKAIRTEPILARAVSRSRLMASYLGPALITTVIMQLLSVLGLWFAASATVENPFDLSQAIAGALAYVIVIWILLGLTATLFGFAPQLVNFSWVYLGYTLFTVYFGKILQLPEWMAKLSPWGYIPQVPIEPIKASAVVLALLIAIILMGLGFYGYNKRDVYG